MGEASGAMRVWTLVDDLVVEVFRMAWNRQAPGFEEISAVARGCAVRVALRVARGLQGTPEELRAAIRSSFGSLAELRYYLHLARKLGLIDLSGYKAACARHERLHRCLKELPRLSDPETPAGNALARFPHPDSSGPLPAEFGESEVAPHGGGDSFRQPMDRRPASREPARSPASHTEPGCSARPAPTSHS